MRKQSIPVLDELTALDYNIASMTATIVIGAIYETVYTMYLLRHVIVEREKLKKENLRSQLETLKNQVNPHFLFNSLNTLASVIPEDPKLAVEFVQNLSKVYRYILEIRDRELITVREELECINAYRFLLDIRFGNSVSIEERVEDKAQDLQIVPLSLQMLLENAIKHNIVSQKRPLKIEITSNGIGKLIITNNLQKKKEVNGSTKTGLENIKKRYRILSGKEVEVIVSREHFRVSLPLIQTHEYESTDHRG